MQVLFPVSRCCIQTSHPGHAACMAPRSSAMHGGRHLSSSVCPSASLLFFPSSQEAGAAPESALEEAGMTEMAAMRKQVSCG